MRRFSKIRAVAVNKVQISAIAIPIETLPCSNSLIIKVETTSVLGGAIRLAVTSSRKEMMNVIIQPATMPLASNGNVTRRNV